jgi:uncharacterized membrane protein
MFHCMDTLSHYLTKLRTSLLAVPMLMAVVAFALAQAMLGLGQPADWPLPRWLHGGSPGAARDLLGALLTGIITMFSLVLSVTMVVLTLAAQQIGSRLIRTFIDDRVTQSVIGLFLGAMLYLLVVLAAVDEAAATRVPQPAVAVGMVLAVLCMVALILYVDKLARSIVFDHAAARMSQEVERVCEHLRKDPGCEEARDDRLSADAMRLMQDAGQEGESISLGRDGYVQSVAYDALLRSAQQADVRIRLDVRPGHWVNASTRCIVVLPRSSAELEAAIRSAVIIGTDRTPTQDIEYSLQRLVEMALRALSPGLNDVFTALAAIDNLGASVAGILSHPMPSRTLRDESGALRLVRAVSEPAGIVAAAFDQVRQAGAHMPAVAIRMIDALGRLAPAIRTQRQREAVLAQLDAVLESARLPAMIEPDAESVRLRYRRAQAVLAGATPQSVEDRFGAAGRQRA